MFFSPLTTSYDVRGSNAAAAAAADGVLSLLFSLSFFFNQNPLRMDRTLLRHVDQMCLAPLPSHVD